MERSNTEHYNTIIGAEQKLNKREQKEKVWIAKDFS